jgi:hypothetical protein
MYTIWKQSHNQDTVEPSDRRFIGAVGDEHHFILLCSALATVRDRFHPLFACGTRSLTFIWQQDLREVVRFVHECFVFRATVTWSMRLIHLIRL